MFYIVESDKQLGNLTGYCSHGCYVEVIPSNYNYHPMINEPVAVYVRPVDLAHGFIIPINHSEGLNVDTTVVSDILQSLCTLYTIDKKDYLYYYKSKDVRDVSLLYSMTYYDKLEVSNPLDRFNWFYQQYNIKDVNKLIPLSKLYEFYEERFTKVKEFISLDIPSGYDFYNDTATEVFLEIEKAGIGVKKEFLEMFTPKDPRYNISNSKIFTKYNLNNVTSRPTNAFNSVNFAAIPKSEGHRNSFRPENDYFIEFDFDGYHVRLLCDQISYELTGESAHKQLAKQYFGKNDIDEDEYKEAKQINFHAIYGKIPEKWSSLEIFRKIDSFIRELWRRFEDDGEVLAPISGKSFSRGLRDMHPAKLMNYIMQSLETSRNILILKNVLDYLKDKKSKVVLYTYDAVLFDFSLEDGKQVLIDLERILSEDNKYPVNFKKSDSMVL